MLAALKRKDLNPDVDRRPAEYDSAIAEAQEDLKYLLNTCPRASRRFSRVYVYSWAGAKDPDANADRKTDTDRQGNPRYGFDTGLTDVYTPTTNSTPGNRYELRPTYDVFQAATP